MNKNKIIIIFSGYNNRAVVSFIRTLEKNKISYVVIARNNIDPIFKTAYKNKVILTRKNQDLSPDLIKEYIVTIQNKYNVTQYCIAPSTETLNRFLQSERKVLEEMNVIVPLVDSNIYVAVSDKKAFSDICKKNDIMLPGEYNSIMDATLPFVAKPKEYFTQNGSIYTPFIIHNNSQKDSFLETCDPIDFYFQKYIQGRSIYLLYYFHRNGQTYKFSQENVIQQSQGKSMVAAVSSDFHNTDESIKYEKLFRKIGFWGLVMVELKVNRENIYMIEANPRFWGPSQLFVDADMNFFESFLHDYEFLNREIIFQACSEEIKYFWFGGVQHTLKKQKKLSFHKGSEKELLTNLDCWIRHDIYKRADTIDVFREEMI